MRRHIIHYILIIISLFVLIIIFLTIYNEYSNEKKLQTIKKQINYTKQLKELSQLSINELINAQINLNEFIHKRNKANLDSFSISLKQITKNIDLLNNAIAFKSDLKFDFSKSNKDKFDKYKLSIDSISKIKISPISEMKIYQPKEFEFRDTIQHFEMTIHYSTDSITKKKFFRRLIDVFKKAPDIRRDTVFIQTKYGFTLDTSKIKSDYDSIIYLINQHYLTELNKYQGFILKTNLKNNQLYQTYGNLMWTGIELMNIYENAIDNYYTQLLNLFNEQNAKINSIRKYSTLGLIVLIFLILILLLYYTTQSFKYEIELNKSNQRIKEDLDFKIRLLGMLSHEVRSPLKIINIFIDKINRKTNDKNLKNYLDLISYTNDILLIQSNQILEYTKNQYSPIILNKVEFELQGEINNILAIFSSFIATKGNKLESNIDINENTIVFTDRIKIYQLFSNILGNANKFTENGKIITNVTALSKPNCILLKVSILDNGSGILQSDIEQVFDTFYRGTLSNKIENIGVGLGLSLCKEIVEVFNGNINIESELNKGTKVDFELNLNTKK